MLVAAIWIDDLDTIDGRLVLYRSHAGVHGELSADLFILIHAHVD